MIQRVAFVTGGMGGIGTAVCRRLGEAGHKIVAGCLPGYDRRDEWLAAMRGEMAILLVEQRASLVLPLCESALILNNGAVAYSGDARDLLARERDLQQLLGV